MQKLIRAKGRTTAQFRHKLARTMSSDLNCGLNPPRCLRHILCHKVLVSLFGLLTGISCFGVSEVTSA